MILIDSHLSCDLDIRVYKKRVESIFYYNYYVLLFMFQLSQAAYPYFCSKLQVRGSYVDRVYWSWPLLIWLYKVWLNFARLNNIAS